MKSTIKGAVQSLARRFGFELKSLAGIPKEEIPGWLQTNGLLPEDESVPGPWESSAQEMVTHAYRPAQLRYHRRSFGEDYRIKYVASFLDVRGLRVLELGPCEGYWSVLLEKMGVRENVALELRPENVAKCQQIKQRHQLDRTTFLIQNIEDLYNGKAAPGYAGPFDLVFAVGFLYHVPDPAKAIRWFRTQAPRLFLGTLYVEPAERRRYLPELFHEADSRDGDTLYQGMEYREGGMRDPISGASDFSFWPFEADLIAMLRDAGYSRIDVLGKDLLNRMPHITLMAEADGPPATDPAKETPERTAAFDQSFPGAPAP